MSEKTRLVKNTGLIALGNIGAKAVAFLLLPLYTSILSTEEYGTYDFIVAISAFLLPIITMSMHEALFRFIIDSGKEGIEFKKIISNSFFIVLFGIICFCIVMLIIDLIFPALTNLKYICIYVISSALFCFSNNLLRGLGRIKEFAFLSSGKNILQIILNVLVILVFRLGMKGLLFSLCISELLSFIIVAIISKMFKYISPKYISFKEIRIMMNYSLPLIPNALSAQIINLSDRVVIKEFLGSSFNGIYSVAYKFPNIIEILYHFFYNAWSESASRVFAAGKENAQAFYQSLYNIISNLLFSVILLMISCMPVLFRIFVKGDYTAGFVYIPILLMAIYFDCLAKFYSGIFTALKKTKSMATSTTISAVLNLVINILFIRKIGLYAAALSTLISDIVLVLLRMRYIYKDILIRINKKLAVSKLLLIVCAFLLYSYNDWLKTIVLISLAFLSACIMNKELIKKIYNKIKKYQINSSICN